MKRLFAVLALATVACPAMGVAQGMVYPPAAAEQKAAMAKLAFLHGEWRGRDFLITPFGDMNLVRTQRVGLILDGMALIIDGNAYAIDGSLKFSALAVIS